MNTGRIILTLLLLASAVTAHSEGSFVMTLYHHVSGETPRSTSLTVEELETHIQWLKEHDFTIKALPDAIRELKAGQYDNHDRVAVISFDDSYRSICENGWPLLKKYHVPFTVFMTAGQVKNKLAGQCTIEQLKTMVDSGLVTIGNHSMTHPHMTDATGFANKDAWLLAMRKEITDAQAFIEKHFGEQPKYFAYPYGEMNKDLQALVQSLGFTGFGQHSGAIGTYSDFTALPRFPLAGRYAAMDQIPNKLLSLALPATIGDVTDNPIKQASKDNPPRLELALQKPVKQPIQCFLGNGSAINARRNKQQLVVQHEGRLPAGRQRYNCTAASGIDGRFYWFSHQWVIEK